MEIVKLAAELGISGHDSEKHFSVCSASVGFMHVTKLSTCFNAFPEQDRFLELGPQRRKTSTTANPKPSEVGGSLSIDSNGFWNRKHWFCTLALF